MKEAKIRSRYNELINKVRNDKFYKIDLTNRVNCYVCDKCGHITKTKDVAAGVTPAFYDCEECKNLAHSSFYTDIRPLQKPTIEFYRPSLDELMKEYKDNDDILEHVLKGGLLDRKIDNKE